ncbi:MAG: hypothetical protein GY792_17675 [Gammaproteobacteria bacterium]|nr:hypothetical protein [Gammaproteobacteria bacterium]
MANARDQMRMLEAELDRVQREMAGLKIEEALLLKMVNKMKGNSGSGDQPRTRSRNVKPIVLDIMRLAEHTGATTAEVDKEVRAHVPSVKRDTVGSVLSRLKSEGALVYVNDRYYEKQFAPKDDDNPFKISLQAVN